MFSTKRRDCPNGKSQPAIHGPARASRASNPARSPKVSSASTRSVSPASVHVTAVTGLRRLGVLVKSTPTTRIPPAFCRDPALASAARFGDGARSDARVGARADARAGARAGAWVGARADARAGCPGRYPSPNRSRDVALRHGARHRSVADDEHLSGDDQFDPLAGVGHALVEPPLGVPEASSERRLGHQSGPDLVGHEHERQTKARERVQQACARGVHVVLAEHQVRQPQRQAVDEHDIGCRLRSTPGRRGDLLERVRQRERRLDGAPARVTIRPVAGDALAHLVVERLGGDHDRTPFAERLGENLRASTLARTRPAEHQCRPLRHVSRAVTGRHGVCSARDAVPIVG